MFSKPLACDKQDGKILHLKMTQIQFWDAPIFQEIESLWKEETLKVFNRS